MLPLTTENHPKLISKKYPKKANDFNDFIGFGVFTRHGLWILGSRDPKILESRDFGIWDLGFRV